MDCWGVCHHCKVGHSVATILLVSSLYHTLCGLVLPYQSCCSNLINPGNPKKCECNGHKNAGGGGECNGVFRAECGSHWCYVDNDAQCMDTLPSSNSPYRYTCEACLGEYRKPGAYAKIALALPRDVSALRHAGIKDSTNSLSL